jgi:tetratricopeptide (TPR) repeat protein
MNIQAQEKKLLKAGNKLYEEKKFKEAANAYQQSVLKNPTYTPGLFNLGNSLYKEKQYDAARKVLSSAAKTTKEKDAIGGMNYNIGNTYMAEQKWEDAVNAYKQALRDNPQDTDAKYNLSYAQQMLKKQQQQNKDNKDKDKQDKNKDKKDDKNKKDDKQNKDKDQQKKEEQNKDQQNKDEKQEQKPQSQPSKLSEKQAAQLLNALQQEEKKLQDKLQKGKGTPVKVEKDW